MYEEIKNSWYIKNSVYTILLDLYTPTTKTERKSRIQRVLSLILSKDIQSTSYEKWKQNRKFLVLLYCFELFFLLRPLTRSE